MPAAHTTNNTYNKTRMMDGWMDGQSDSQVGHNALTFIFMRAL
jgi:hypothetical protein